MYIGKSLCTNCGVRCQVCSYVQTVLTIGYLQFKKRCIYRVSNKKSYSSFWLVFKNACANFIQTYHEYSAKDGKNHSHKSKQLGCVAASRMCFA